MRIDSTWLSKPLAASWDLMSFRAPLIIPNHGDQWQRKLWHETFILIKQIDVSFAKNETLRHPFVSASQNIDLICAYFDLTTHKHNISQPWNSWKILLLSTCALRCLFITHHYKVKKNCNESTSSEKNPCSALKESVKSPVLIEMHLLLTFADPLFQHYAWFF